MNERVIECSALEIGFGRGLIPPFDLAVKKGEILGITGPNGGGKTTFVKTLCGIIPPVSGKISFPLGELRFGYVPQQTNGSPEHPFTAYETVLLGGSGKKGKEKCSFKEKAVEKMTMLGISSLKDERFCNLSGGQKQRVLIARALISEPDILVLDEPSQGIDIDGENSFVETVKKLNEVSGTTVILISHQNNLLSELSTRIITMERKGIKEGK